MDNNFGNNIRALQYDVSSIMGDVRNMKRDISILQSRMPKASPIRRVPTPGNRDHANRRMNARSAKSPSKKLRKKKRKSQKRKSKKRKSKKRKTRRKR